MPATVHASEDSPSMRGLRAALLPLPWSVVFLLLLCFFSPTTSSSSLPPVVQGSQSLVCNSRDRDALVGFSGSLDSGVPGWFSNASLSCCRWAGVLCGVPYSSRNSSSASETRVVGLELGKLDLRARGFFGWKTLLGLDELRTLNLSQNSLGGVIAPELFQLRQLEVLDLSGNLFSGDLRNEIGNLLALRHLDISSNGFSGPIPDAFDGLRKLHFFSARSNLFTGGLPSSLSSCSMLASLDLGNNSLTGRIGLDCTRIVRLRTLRLDSNGFAGHIPRKLSSCRELEILNLAKNRLHGQVPWTFKNLQALSSLSLAHNALFNVSRALTALSVCRTLTILDLSANFGSETLPEGGIGGFESLEALVVADCPLYGPVPSWVRRCAGLRLLDLSFNDLSGPIPPWLGNFPRLCYLDLSNNKLNGVLPDALANLCSLTSVNIARTDDSPIEFPFHARRNRSLEVIYRRFSSVPPTLDLSQNVLDGHILKGLGNLTRLIVLDLSHNQFSGPIPEEFSAMIQLEYLDLSFNNLSGSIPPDLGLLTFLSEFSVAYNNLEGPIPESGQFFSFSDSSYEGNQGLCSRDLPVLWNCFRDRRPTPGPPHVADDEKEFRIAFMPLPYGIGVLMGFIPTVICGAYRVYRRRRKKERQE